MRKAILLAVLAALPLPATQVQANGILYLIDGTNLYTVNTSSAVLTLVGPGFDDGLAPGSLPSSFLFSADNNPDLYALKVDGSGQTFLATIGGDGNRGLAFNQVTNVLYGTDNLEFGIIDPTSGAFTTLASPPEEPEALAADPINNLVYGLSTNENLIVYDVSSDSWSTVGATLVDDGGKAGLAFDPVSGVLYAGDRSGFLYSIDPDTVATTLIGSTGVDTGLGLAFVPTEIFTDGFESGDTSAWSSTVQ